jgi:AbrB family looped-hinge helix DNA binding protein
MSITTVTAKGQVTIPRDIRESLDLTQGDKILFILEADRAILVPIAKKRPLRNLYAALPATRPYPGLDLIRQEVHSQLAERIQRGDK